jgi:hypothetical protein
VSEQLAQAQLALELNGEVAALAPLGKLLVERMVDGV